jgi:branched-chain amino acid aminotransferase
MAPVKGKYIWMDGHFVEWDSATVHVGTHALHYGSSVFEGVRAYGTPRGAAIFCLDQHTDRLFDSAKMYKMTIPFTSEELRNATIETVRVNELESGYIRPIAFRGYENFSLDPRKCPVQVAIIAFPWGRYLGPESVEKGVDVGVSSWRRMATGTFPALGKVGGQYINSQFVAMEAADHGYMEGIALDINGYVSEGSGENIFVVSDGIIHTPPLATSILKGITPSGDHARARGWIQVIEQNIREMLYVADEIFFTGTAAEVTPIRSIDASRWGGVNADPSQKRSRTNSSQLLKGRRKTDSNG